MRNYFRILFWIRCFTDTLVEAVPSKMVRDIAKQLDISDTIVVDSLKVKELKKCLLCRLTNRS